MATEPVVGVKIHGLKQLQRALAKAEKDSRKNVRVALRAVAQPIQAGAEARAQQFTNIGPKWFKMRIGVSRSVVYVAPRQRGKGIGTPRPLFGTKLMDEAMDPALESQRPFLEAAVGRALDQMADEFHSPP